jgi:hypothetical protein
VDKSKKISARDTYLFQTAKPSKPNGRQWKKSSRTISMGGRVGTFTGSAYAEATGKSSSSRSCCTWTQRRGSGNVHAWWTNIDEEHASRRWFGEFVSMTVTDIPVSENMIASLNKGENAQGANWNFKF